MRDPRGYDLALWATWQRHAGPRGAYAALHIYLLLLYSINGFSAFRSPEGYSTHKIVGSYKPDDSLSFIPCGTNPHRFYNAGDVAQRGATDQTAINQRASIACAVDTDGSIKHVLFKRIITVRFKATWRHHTRRSGGRAVHGSEINARVI